VDPQKLAVFRKERRPIVVYTTRLTPATPIVVTTDNPQRCYCRCNFFSVILSLLAKVFVIWRKEFICQKPPRITLDFVCFDLFWLDMFTEE
jgi:hypothetical protein